MRHKVKWFSRIMLLLLLLQLINYMNDKFQKYKDVLSPQQDKIRLKRKVNETNENIRGLLSPRWPESRRNKTLHTTINRGQEENKILHNFTRPLSIGRYAPCYTLCVDIMWFFKTENKTKSNYNESHHGGGGERLATGRVESFSFYMSKDRQEDSLII